MMQEETVDGDEADGQSGVPRPADAIAGARAGDAVPRAAAADGVGATAKMSGIARLIVKLQGCELNHQLAALAIDVLGELGVLYGDSPHLRNQGTWQRAYMFDLGLIIGGGTAQIQKNIIAERGLGMPREPKIAKARVKSWNSHFSADQKMMQDSVDAHARARLPARPRAQGGGERKKRSRAMCGTRLVELGAPALLIPEESWRAWTLNLLDAALVSEALGRHVAPVPFIASCVMAPLALRDPVAAQQSEWLPKLASGKTLAGVAISESDFRRARWRGRYSEAVAS